ncbi:hypothetical protein CCFV1_ORF055 [Cotesia congregata filamentous virus 1]|uniref:Uncharacterized protein n=1 Tax=Cotesia congregata filamentous virus 1 TaxID=3064291 RepID=A0ABC8QK59_9VIRU|nr:hypothetical protein CCFV1_ORF055 [Cotesia congregata filamentous virus 1]
METRSVSLIMTVAGSVTPPPVERSVVRTPMLPRHVRLDPSVSLIMTATGHTGAHRCYVYTPHPPPYTNVLSHNPIDPSVSFIMTATGRT